MSGELISMRKKSRNNVLGNFWHLPEVNEKKRGKSGAKLYKAGMKGRVGLR